MLMQKISKRTVLRWTRRGNCIFNKERRPGNRVMTPAAVEEATKLLVDENIGGGRAVAKRLHQQGLTRRQAGANTVISACRKAAASQGQKLVNLRGKPQKALTESTKRKRRLFAQKNLHRDWSNVMITDRCKFFFKFPGSKVTTSRWRREGEEDNSDAVWQPNNPQAYNVYGGITKNGTTALIPVTGTSGFVTDYRNQRGEKSRNITKLEYEDVSRKLFEAGDKLFRSSTSRSWVFQQDNDPTHNAARTYATRFNKEQQATRGRTVEVIKDWPPHSPDLSPIENVWAHVYREVNKKGCNSFQEFKDEIDKSFQNLPKSMIDNLWKSLPKRMAECVEKQGRKTKY